MSIDKQSVDFMKQALSAINLVEEPVSYEQYLEGKGLCPHCGCEIGSPKPGCDCKHDHDMPEDSEFDMDMRAEPDHPDHEVNMARSDLYKTMGYARDIYKMLERVSEEEGIEGWVASKMTKAADYLSSVKHYIEHEIARADMSGESIEEKAVSKSQQQAAGAALAAKRGDAPKSSLQGASKEMMKMSTKELEKFAGTKHKGLPKKKESIGESTMTDTNKKKLSEGISIQTDTLEDQIALMAILKNAGLDPQQMNIQQQPSMDAPAPDMAPDAPAPDMPGDEPEQEAFDNQPDEKFLDKDDFELKRNKVPNKDMGPASATHGDNPFTEGKVKGMMMDMEDDAADMSKEEFVKAHGEKYAYIWDRVQGQMKGDPQYDESVEEAKSKPDYLDFDKDGDKKEPMKKALKDKAKKESAPSDTDSLIAELNKQYELMLIGGKQAQLGLTASARVIADEVMYDGSRFVVAEVVDKGEEGLVAEDGSWEGETTPYRVAYHIVDDEIVGQVGAGEVPYLSRDGNGAFPVKHKLNNLDLNESNFFADYVSAVDKIKAMYEDLGNKMFGEVTATFGGCEMIRND